MPGELPPTSAYTYAVELTVDQAEEEGKKGVRFDPPVLSYVDNFLEFPAGTIVPVGYYDEDRDAWQAMDSGVVLDIVSVAGGMAELDVDGDGEADDVSFGYDDAGRLVRDRFGTTVEFAYDDDDLLVTAGAEQITRDPETGLVAATQLETIAEALDYNTYGELIEHTAGAGVSELYARNETRDGLGRVVARTETVLGDSAALEYEYDARGRLIEVTTDGLVTASYTYDGNGNRLSVTRGVATVLASYDAQDRLIAHGALSFVHDARQRGREDRWR
jgi:YD repeat-containing protein